MSAPADGAADAAAISAVKAGLRNATLAARRRTQLNPEENERRCAALLAVPEVAAARVVAGYAALPGEPDIACALDELASRGARVLLPVVLSDRDLQFRERTTGAALVIGRLGAREPGPGAATVPLAEADVVLVPALAADRVGHRLGRGGGSYDRALRRVRPGALVIAIVRGSELFEAVPVESHDFVVSAVLAGDSFLRVKPGGNADQRLSERRRATPRGRPVSGPCGTRSGPGSR